MSRDHLSIGGTEQPLRASIVLARTADRKVPADYDDDDGRHPAATSDNGNGTSHCGDGNALQPVTSEGLVTSLLVKKGYNTSNRGVQSSQRTILLEENSLDLLSFRGDHSSFPQPTSR